MTGEVCDGIFVHALMQKRRDKKVAQGVQAIGFGKTDFRKQGFQVLAERVRMDGRAVVFCENVFREWDTMLIAESHFAIAEPAQQAEHFFVHRNSSGATIFRFTLLHTLAGNGAARVLDNDIALVTASCYRFVIPRVFASNASVPSTKSAEFHSNLPTASTRFRAHLGHNLGQGSWANSGGIPNGVDMDCSLDFADSQVMKEPKLPHA